MKPRLLLLLFILLRSAGAAEETWGTALSRMPLVENPGFLNHTNCPQVLLPSLRSNVTAKALVFMPGATDELFFFKRVQVRLTNNAPTLLDAVVALTNQSPLRVTFQPPFVLLYSGEDLLELDLKVNHARTKRKLEQGKSLPHLLAIDRDWTQLLGQMKKKIPATLLPFERTPGSWHFYRHTFAGWNLTPWEMLQTAAYAGKTRFTVVRGGVVFEPDPRVGALPKLDRFPGR